MFPSKQRKKRRKQTPRFVTDTPQTNQANFLAPAATRAPRSRTSSERRSSPHDFSLFHDDALQYLLVSDFHAQACSRSLPLLSLRPYWRSSPSIFSPEGILGPCFLSHFFFLPSFFLSLSIYSLSHKTPKSIKSTQTPVHQKKNLPPQQQNAFRLAGSYPATHTRLWLRGPFGPLPPTPLGAPEPSVTHDRAFARGPDHHLGLPPLFPRGLPAHLEGGRHICHPDPAPAWIYRFGVGVVGFCDGGP